MKKIVTIAVIGLIVWAISVYVLYYSIFSKMRFRLDGFKLKNEEGEFNIKEKMALNIGITNNSSFNAKINLVQVFIVNEEGVEIGKISPIKNLDIEANSEVIVPISINSINVTQLIADAAQGKILSYQYKVRVVFFRFLPFWFKSKLI